MSMPYGHQLDLGEQSVWLLPEKALYVPQSQSLAIADLHLGKSTHFRKAGIMMPAGMGHENDYHRLNKLADLLRPKRILFLGDLFHSELNSDWDLFRAFMQERSEIEMVLIQGNHDILQKGLYLEAGLALMPMLEEHTFLYTHEPMAKVPEGTTNIAGHIHPGCVVKGGGRQNIKLPCFHYENPLLLLPSFGNLTGCYVLPRNGAKQYAVAKDKLFEI